MELRADVEVVFIENDSRMANILNDENWVCKLPDQDDMYCKMNKLNL